VLVRILQRPRYVERDPEGDFHWELGHPGEAVAETLPLHIGHREPELPGRLPGVVHRQDIRVLEPGRQLDLALAQLRPADWLDTPGKVLHVETGSLD
jgi:hypothetical protein